MPLKSDELQKLGLGQFPIVIGGVVVVVNIDGVGPGEIKFTGPLLADIFLGKIQSWSDPAIKALNPDLKLPDAKIAVVHRSDGSGTTFNFTDYLSKVSPQWREKVGSDLLVPWPTGTGAKGNEGVAQAVEQTRNSIGYVEYAQALQTKLSYALIQNRAGRFVRPDAASFQAAAASADWGQTSDFYLLLTDAPGDERLSDRRDGLRADAQDRSRRGAPGPRSISSGGRWKGRERCRASSATCRCRKLVKQVKDYWAKNFKAGT